LTYGNTVAVEFKTISTHLAFWRILIWTINDRLMLASGEFSTTITSLYILETDSLVL
jgi:hypothetical protein